MINTIIAMTNASLDNDFLLLDCLYRKGCRNYPAYKSLLSNVYTACVVKTSQYTVVKQIKLIAQDIQNDSSSFDELCVSINALYKNNMISLDNHFFLYGLAWTLISYIYEEKIIK